ncbi:hypothetical protein [Caldivirga sp. UBA161]|nr:hypothetical protein [Caldivirga sp. UBA161]
MDFTLLLGFRINGKMVRGWDIAVWLKDIDLQYALAIPKYPRE